MIDISSENLPLLANRAAAVLGAMYSNIQPAASGDSFIRWGRATGNWHNAADNASYVDCNPASDFSASTYDSSVTHRVYLPRCAGSDPNVVGGQCIAYSVCGDGSCVALSGYLDAAIGTVRMWSPNLGDPPVGWTECKPGGTDGRPSPVLSGLQGRFPIGRKTSDERYDTTGATGGSDDGTHTHQMQMDMSYPDLAHSVEIDFGIHGTHIMTMLGEDTQPPWCVVRFIERYDNSAL